MSCQSLLGLAFSLARGLDPLSEELNSGPFPLSIPESSEQEGKKTDRKREPRTSHDIGEFVFNHLLKYLPCCVSFTIHGVPKQFQKPTSKCRLK